MTGRQYDIGKLSLTDTVQLLRKEGYELMEQNDKGEFVALLVHADEDVPDAEYYKDYGYSLNYFDSAEAANEDLIGCLHCGGMYTCATLYRNEVNITQDQLEGFMQVGTMLPRGDILIDRYALDDGEDDESSRNSCQKNDIGSTTLSETLQLLDTEEYKLIEKVSEGEYVVLVVPAGEDMPGAVHFKDYGYSLYYFDTEEAAYEDLIGCLHCGGLYTCAALFKGETNITLDQPESYVQLETILPSGKTAIIEDDTIQSESDEECETGSDPNEASIATAQSEKRTSEEMTRDSNKKSRKA